MTDITDSAYRGAGQCVELADFTRTEFDLHEIAITGDDHSKYTCCSSKLGSLTSMDFDIVNFDTNGDLAHGQTVSDLDLSII